MGGIAEICECSLDADVAVLKFCRAEEPSREFVEAEVYLRTRLNGFDKAEVSVGVIELFVSSRPVAVIGIELIFVCSGDMLP